MFTARHLEKPETLNRISSHLLALANLDQPVTLTDFKTSPHYVALDKLVSAGRKLTFVLPAFPAKSPNPEKTSGPLPDLGEVIGLQRLNQFCRHVASVYEPGCELVVASDGRVFNDLVKVSDGGVAAYQSSIRDILTDFELDHLRLYSLDDCRAGETFEESRRWLVETHGLPIENLRTELGMTDAGRLMFNGIHRFMKEDAQGLDPLKSRSQVERESKAAAWEVIRRSRAWDHHLAEVFPSTLRLSIHPYPLRHHKLGIRLLEGPNRWATPWHNVTVKTKGGYVLMKRSQAAAAGAALKHFRKSYAYFES